MTEEMRTAETIPVDNAGAQPSEKKVWLVTGAGRGQGGLGDVDAQAATRSGHEPDLLLARLSAGVVDGHGLGRAHLFGHCCSTSFSMD